MLGKLVKFIILSRVSKGGLALLIMFTAIAVVSDVGLYEAEAYGHMHFYPLYYSLGYLTAYYVLFALIGGIVVMKADLDYLFTLPIDRKLLSLALFISNLILFALFMAFIATFSFNAYLFFVSPLLGLSLVSLNVLLRDVKVLYKVLTATVIALWFISPIWGFPFSPTSAAIGYFPTSLAITLAYTVFLTYLALKRLENYEQLVVRSVTEAPAVERYVTSFGPSTPLRTFLKLKLTYLPFTGRIGSFGGAQARYFARAIRMRTIFAVFVTLAAIYYSVVRDFLVSSPSMSVTGVSIVIAYATVFGYGTGVSNLMVERAWLTVPYLGSRFLKYLVLSVWVQVTVLLIPIAAANFMLSVYNPLFLYAGLSILVDAPLISAFTAYLQAAVLPIQLKDELTPLNAEMRARSAITVVVFMVPFYLEFYGLFTQSLLVILGAGLGMAVVLAFLTQDNMSRRVINKMTEMGYV